MTQANLQQQAHHAEIKAFIESGCTFEGSLTFTGVVRLNGCLKGDITTNDTLIIGESGEVVGNVNVGALLLNGRVLGDIRAAQKVEMNSTAYFEGSLCAPILVTAHGAKLMGHINVSDQKSSLPGPKQK